MAGSNGEFIARFYASNLKITVLNRLSEHISCARKTF